MNEDIHNNNRKVERKEVERSEIHEEVKKKKILKRKEGEQENKLEI